MTDYPHEPPERMFADTILAFKDFQMASAWSVRVSADPLGPVNKIVSLMRGGKRIKSVLCLVPAGANVRLVREEGSGYRGWDHSWNQVPVSVYRNFPPYREPGWRVEVNGETVLTVTDAEMRPPYVAPPPPPLWTRMRKVLREQVRADVDWVAGRLGYHRDEDCGYDE